MKASIFELKENNKKNYENLCAFLFEMDPSLGAPARKLSNPGALGLGGFGAAVIIFQLHSLGYVGIGPTMWTAIVLGGLMQLIAGLHEFKTGNNFGYAAFNIFGGLWFCFGLIVLGKQFNWYELPRTDMGMLLIVFTLFTFLFLYPAANIDMALFSTFAVLFIGFVFGDIAHFVDFKPLDVISCLCFIVGGLLSWYIMAHVIFLDIFKKDILPVGAPPLTTLMNRRHANPAGQSMRNEQHA
uniref:GPR1/FUN34/yaaH family protein n=1 Tax=Trichuris muris TaxID=70415 RepID=A0A5S6R4L6_TRIMR